MTGYTLAATSLVLFGFWGFVAKLATDAAGSKFVFIFAQIPYIVIASAMLLLTGPYAIKWEAMRWTLVGGALGAVGVLMFFLAIDKMSAAQVVPITAAYPAITIALSVVILGERLTPRHLIGAILALAGVALLA